ncbi:MAG: serine protease [Anaerolineae bacterium]|nr:serine protease [Anaerolineae bacterium]
MTQKEVKLLEVDRANLHFAAPLLSLKNKIALGLTVPATIYVQDPLVAKKSRGRLGLEDIHVTWEPDLAPGPTSSRLAVVDYDGDKNELIPPARWDERRKCFVFGSSRRPVRIGKENADCPQFRQVNVWAVIQNILDFYEDPCVLGRPISWGFQGNRLIIVPHAGCCENAFYDRHSKSLQFYYFGPERDPVYTCLSHDVVAHETGHAVLDGIRPYYYENSSIQTAAFHEFIADLTAIVSALRNNKVRHAIAEVTGGDLSRENAIADLAEQFGKSLVDATYDTGSRYFLRSAHNAVTVKDIDGVLSPHRCSNVLTGAMFEILTLIAKKYLDKGETAKLALWRATDAIRRISLQALDYLPPVDVQFIDYAYAVLRAHQLSSPQGEEYDSLMRAVFSARGLNDLDDATRPDRLAFRRYDIDRLSGSRTAAYRFLSENRRVLCIPAEQDFVVADLYATDKITSGAARLPREIVIEYVWSEDIELKGPRFGQLGGKRISLLCGGTLVLDGRGNLLYWVRKPGTGKLIRGRGPESEYRKGERERGMRRREQLMNYVVSLVAAGQVALTDGLGAQGLDIWAPPVVGRQVGGMLHLEAVPHMRHGRGC